MHACGHGLNPVYDQVQDDLLHLAAVAGVEPPAAIRLRHRVSNLNKRPALGKTALPLGDVRKVVSEERDQPAFADYSR
jgi:hypothetical protein